ncbi:MAG: sarcosine oxidase subunit delta [Lautropia sp.]|nr:sarcosine oxidase subunit delta [Lautropia sp.]
MLLIHCPWCGPRAESEFNYGGESGIVRPVEAASKDKESWLTDEQWGDYVFMRKNTRGRFIEQWVHTHGCRKWFDAERDTSNHRFIATYPLGKAPGTPKNAAQERPANAGEQTKP